MRLTVCCCILTRNSSPSSYESTNLSRWTRQNNFLFCFFKKERKKNPEGKLTLLGGKVFDYPLSLLFLMCYVLCVCVWRKTSVKVLNK
jgi:hypothetical protein